jgi:tripartite-type tricarboxylate transporter receptor subunit TctC
MYQGFTRRAVLGSLGAVTLSGLAQAQPKYPSEPIRFVVPYSPGGAVDVVARAIGNVITNDLRQPIIIDNKTGANTAIGAGYVAKARPDGYTLLVTGSSTMVTGPLLYKKLPYKPSDFAPVALLTKVPMVIAVNENVKGAFPEIIERIRQAPNTFTYGHTGLGSLGHLIGESMFARYGLHIASAPYRGFPAMLQDMIGGSIQMVSESAAAVLPMHRAGKVRIVAVTSSERFAELPEVPTLVELGLADFVCYGWFSLLAPTGTQEPIIRRLTKAVEIGSADPGYRRLIQGTGQQMAYGTPEVLASLIEKDTARWRPLVERLNLKLD